MEIPGISPLGGQPTLTNPLNQERLLEGRATQAQSSSETQNTVTANEQSSTTIRSAEVVTEVEETSGSQFDAATIGRNIDLTA